MEPNLIPKSSRDFRAIPVNVSHAARPDCEQADIELSSKEKKGGGSTLNRKITIGYFTRLDGSCTGLYP